jgi:hypothetical protein
MMNTHLDISSRMEEHSTLHTPAWLKFSPFRRPRNFEGILATAIARSNAENLFLKGISEWENLPNQTTKHRGIESKYHLRISGNANVHTGKEFTIYGAPVSILSERKLWSLPAHVTMSSNFSHNERTPVEILLQYSHWCKNY